MIFFMDIENSDDRDKVVRLYKDYRKLMFKEAYTILQDTALSEDAVHDAFVKVIRYLHKVDENNRPQTRNYLATICRNTAIDMLKKTSDKHTADDEEILSKQAQDMPDSLEIIIKRETLDEIAEAIELLDPIYRDVFLLRRVHNHSRDEIAEILNINVETVKKRLTRAKQKIVRYLNRRDENGQR